MEQDNRKGGCWGSHLRVTSEGTALEGPKPEAKTTCWVTSGGTASEGPKIEAKTTLRVTSEGATPEGPKIEANTTARCRGVKVTERSLSAKPASEAPMIRRRTFRKTW